MGGDVNTMSPPILVIANQEFQLYSPPMPSTSEMTELFDALFGENHGLVKVDGRWTFPEHPGLPKLAGEGILAYLKRLSQNCLAMKGAWIPGTYTKNQVVSYDSKYWVATATTSATPGNAPWDLLLSPLTGLAGRDGVDGVDSIITV